MACSDEYDYVAILHGDNQAITSELNNLIDLAENDPKLDAIMGARFLPASTLIGYSLLRIYGNKVINLVYSLLSFKRIHDLGSGLNLFKVSFIKKINYLDCNSSLTFNMDLLLEMIKKRGNFIYTPITWREEDQVSNARIFDIGSRSLLQLFKWRIGQRKPAFTTKLLTTPYKA